MKARMKKDRGSSLGTRQTWGGEEGWKMGKKRDGRRRTQHKNKRGKRRARNETRWMVGKTRGIFFSKMRKDGNGKATMTKTERRMKLGVERERKRGDRERRSAQAESTARVTRLTPSADQLLFSRIILFGGALSALQALRGCVSALSLFAGREEFKSSIGRVISAKRLFPYARITWKKGEFREKVYLFLADLFG